MSLLLRKQAQPLLDQAGLGEYHADILKRCGSDPYLEILGECGRPLVRLFNVRFNRRSPTNKEIDFAVELLREWLDTHYEVLETFRKAKSKRMESVELNVDDSPFIINLHWSDEKGNHMVRYMQDGYRIMLRPDGYIQELNYDSENQGITSFRYYQQPSFEVDKVLAKEALTFMKKRCALKKKISATQDAYAKAYEAVAKCDVA